MQRGTRLVRVPPMVSACEILRPAYYPFARASISLNSSSLNSMRAAAMFSSRCATEDVPGMGSMLGDRFSSQASAIWLGAASCACAI